MVVPRGPPPTHMGPPGGMPPMGYRPGYGMRPRLGFGISTRGPPSGASTGTGDSDFDGKRPRKSMMRKTVDYNSSFMRMLDRRISDSGVNANRRDRRHALQSDVMYYPELEPPMAYPENPANAVTTRFVKTATNKMRCPVFCLAWTPEGRRLITGASSGEFTLWNGLTFNFETILQVSKIHLSFAAV